MEKLLTRTEFREGVFARDDHHCVICRTAGQDAHHILERRLFCDPAELGGYFLGNGATLCAAHHIQAEETVLSCEQVREAAGIKQVILPSHLYDDVRYDKWGQPGRAERHTPARGIVLRRKRPEDTGSGRRSG